MVYHYWSHLEPFQAIWSYFKPFGAIWSHLEPDLETFNYFFLGGGGIFCTFSSLKKTFIAPFFWLFWPFGWKAVTLLEPFQAILSPFEPFQASWSHLDPIGVIWSYFESFIFAISAFKKNFLELNMGDFFSLKTLFFLKLFGDLFLAPFGLFLSLLGMFGTL